MKFIVTGATGYIGKKLIQRLAEQGEEIYAVVRPSSKTEELLQYVKKIICTACYQELYSELDKIQADMCINLAGCYYGRHRPDNVMELCESNIVFPVHVMDAAIASGTRHIINTASYQQCSNGDRYQPINLYAATKQAYEDILYYYTSTQQISAITLQLFDTYGADDTRNKVFNLVRRLRTGDSIDLSPGKQKMYFCYIDDVVEAYIMAIQQLNNSLIGSYKRYAVRGEEPIELRTFVERYLELSRKKITLHWGAREYMDYEIMDPTGYGEIMPQWSPEISYEQGLILCSESDTCG